MSLQQLQAMALNLDALVFKWLQGFGIIKEGKRNLEGTITLPTEILQKFSDGSLMAITLKNLTHANEGQALKLQTVKDNSSPAIRLYNWTILSQVLRQIGCPLDLKAKQSIMSADADAIAKLLTHLHQLFGKDAKPSLDPFQVDVSEIGKKSLRDSSNIFELLVICISRSFKLSPQHTLNLFLDNNKYLSHLLVKGVKNQYEPIHQCLRQIKEHLDFIVVTLFCTDEQRNAHYFLTCLKTCLISKDLLTAELFLDILNELFDIYRLNMIDVQVIRAWIREEGINTLFFSLKKHASLFESIIEVAYTFLDDELFKYFQLQEKSVLWNSEREKLIFYRNFLSSGTEEILLKFSVTLFHDEWNQLFLKLLKKVKDTEDILLVINILELEWARLPNKFQSHPNAPLSYLHFLKTISQSPSELLFIQSIRILFSQMERLGNQKNMLAPQIYKILIATLETVPASKLHFLVDNFNACFKQMSTLPGGPLVMNLMKIMEKRFDWCLLELSKTLLQDDRISQEQSMELVELLMKGVFHDMIHGPDIIDLIFSSLSNFDQPFKEDFLLSNSKLCLSHFYSNAKFQKKSWKDLKEISKLQNSQEDPNLKNNTFELVLNHMSSMNVVSFISKAIFENNEIKSALEEHIFKTYVMIINELKKQEAAGLLKRIMLTYYSDENQLQAQIQYYMKETYPIPEKSISPPKLAKSIHFMHQTTDTPEITFIDPLRLKPTPSALKDLDKIKQKKSQIQTLEVEKEKQKEFAQLKKEQFRTIMNEKRLIEAMPNGRQDSVYQPLLREKEGEQMDGKIDSNMANMKLIDLEEEEENSYAEDVYAIMKRFRKAWRFLFYKYSKKHDYQNEEKMHMGEAWKMMKDYEMNFFKKEECFALVRLINESLKRKHEPHLLTYLAFEQFIVQAAIYGYSKTQYPHLPPGQLLHLLIDQFKLISKERTGNSEIFENPEEAYFQESQVIKEFNNRLKVNSDYILPEGYKKIKQTSLEFDYHIHPLQQRNIRQNYVEVLQILDEVILNHPSLKFHVIEPIIFKNEKHVAKPVLFQNLVEQLKDYKKGYLLPKTIEDPREKINLKSSSVVITKREIKPFINFSLGIKLGLAEVSLKHRSIADEVAYCMNDMLDSIQNQCSISSLKIRKKTINPYLKKKRGQAQLIETEKKKEEVNWKKRALSVKLEVEALREKRKEVDKEKSKTQNMNKKMKKEKEEKRKRQKMEQFERIKMKIAEKKQVLMELKMEEEEKLKIQKEEYSEEVQEYFKKKKDELRAQEDQLKKKKQEDKYLQEEKADKQKQFVKRLYLSNLKKEEEVLEKIEELKDNFDEVWNSEEIQDEMALNRKALKILFQLLLKLEKSKISATNYDEISLSTLNQFCLKFKIVPFLIQKNTLHKIFIYATKDEKDDKKTYKKGLDFQRFQQLIFLIAVKAKKILNKMVFRRQKKQKKIQKFINAQRNQGGNHFQAAEIQQTSSSEEDSEDQGEEESNLQEDYLFNTDEVNQSTINGIFRFLKLPKDKTSIEEKYKEMMEHKNNKPKQMMIRDLKEELENLVD